MAELIVFVLGGIIILGGGLGVVLSRNPVHSALSLVASLFGIAVLFVAQEAHLLAAVQVIVYTGAIVVLILFVMMLLGVDKIQELDVEPLKGQRIIAYVIGAAALATISVVLLLPVQTSDLEDASVDSVVITGVRVTDPLDPARLQNPFNVETGVAEPTPRSESNIEVIGRSLYTDYVFAFEVTSLLLTIAVVGAVYLARTMRDTQPLPDDPEPMPLASGLLEPDPADEAEESGDGESDESDDADAEEVTA